MRPSRSLALALLLASCTATTAVHDLDAEAPPPELGRPGVVRVFARVGAWVGAAGGAVLSVVALPITFPISCLADEPLGYSREEFLFAPVTMTASAGHFLLGAPPDLVHFLFYRAWATPPPEQVEPMKAPVGPDAPPAPPPQDPATAPTGEPQQPTGERAGEAAKSGGDGGTDYD